MAAASGHRPAGQGAPSTTALGEPSAGQVGAAFTWSWGRLQALGWRSEHHGRWMPPFPHQKVGIIIVFFSASSHDDPVDINNAYKVLDLAKNVPECAMCC